VLPLRTASMDGKRGLLAAFIELLNEIANRTVNPSAAPSSVSVLHPYDVALIIHVDSQRARRFRQSRHQHH
jgi:hypothetical protein